MDKETKTNEIDLKPIQSTEDIQKSLDAVGITKTDISNNVSPKATTTTPAQAKIQDFNAQPTKPVVPKTQVPKLEEKPTQKTDEVTGAQELVQVGNTIFAKISVQKGLALAFFALVSLLWLLVPTASGYTRAQLLWFTLLGETKLTTDTQPDANSVLNLIPNQSPLTTTDTSGTVTQPGPTPSPIIPLNAQGGPIDLSALDFMDSL